MKKKSQVIIILLLSLVISATAIPLNAFSAQKSSASLLFTNDTRGYTEDLSYIRSYKEHTDNSLLVNCANFTKGSAEASLSNAKYSSYLMKEAKYDVISIGNDDFSYGSRALNRLSDYTECDMLSGNVTYSSSAIFKQNVVKDVNGVKIGFFSVCDSASADYIPTARADAYKFEEEITFASLQVQQLKSECDIIVCMANFLNNDKTFTPKKLADEVSGIDVMICSNIGEELSEKINGCIVMSASERLGGLGRVDIVNGSISSYKVLPEYNYDSAGKKLSEVSGTYREYGLSLTYNEARKKNISDFKATVNEKICLNKAVVYAKCEELDASLAEETPLGDIFADAMALAGSKVQSSDTQYKNYRVVALVNGTALQNNLSNGTINLENIFSTENYADSVYFYTVDTDFLFDILEQSIDKVKFDDKTSYISGINEKFLQISGFNIVVNPKNKSGEKITKMYLTQDSKDIEFKRGDSNKYLLAVNEKLADGSSGYSEFLNLKPVYIGDFLTNYVRTYIASNISEDYFVSYGTDSRISFQRINELQPNGDAWATADNKFETYAAADVLLDGIENLDCTQVDENGEVRLTMKTGAHGLSVNGENMYVSTVTGIGIKNGTITPIVDYKLYYKVLDEAYKIDESKYKKAAVDGYFSYLGRAYVQTKLTKEDEVVNATQDIYDVWDAFLSDPDSFIDDGSTDEAADENAETVTYPSIDDFAYKGNYKSSVFENTPVNSSSVNSNSSSGNQNTSSQTKSSAKTGDTLIIVLGALSLVLAATGAIIITVGFKNKKSKKYER